MRPIPIPPEVVWPGAQRRVLGAPNGDLTDDTIRPVEAIVDVPPGLGVPCYTVLAALEPGDLGRLQAGAAVAISLYGHMVPISVDLLDLPGAPRPAGDAWAETTRARMDAWAAADHIPPGRYHVHAVVEVDSTGVPHPAGIEHGLRLRGGLLGPLGPVLLEPVCV